MNASTSATNRARAPFHGPKADVVLRTCDDVDFYVHKLLLSLASSFFDQMFTLPQPYEATPSSEANNTISTPADLPIIPIAEDSQTLDYLLRLCYPVPDPVPATDLTVVAKVLEATLKYDFEEATMLITTLFSSFIETHSLQVFAISCRHKLEDIAGQAAQQLRTTFISVPFAEASCDDQSHFGFSSIPTPCKSIDCRYRTFADTVYAKNYIQEMKGVSAGCYFRLLRYVRTGNLTPFCEPTSAAYPNSPEDHSASPSTPFSLDAQILAQWPADIVLRSSDQRLVPTHQMFLAIASATEILEKAREAACPTDNEGLPVVDLEVDGSTLTRLVRMCQPLEFDVISAEEDITFEAAYAVWLAATKYGMTKVAERARLCWLDFLEDAPLQVYLIGLKHGWLLAAREAARKAIGKPLHAESSYVPELESSSAEALYRLYKYSHHYRNASIEVVARYMKTTQPLDSEPAAALSQGSVVLSDNPAGITMIPYPIVSRMLKKSSQGYYTSQSAFGGGSLYQVPSSVTMEEETRRFFHDVENAVAEIELQTDGNEPAEPRIHDLSKDISPIDYRGKLKAVKRKSKKK
ncbi:hypothetical protein EIP91_002338 [Steccherinum ochraceum]|uniref:BTB domain-containing protein n=1 Tax=Steccherinum ochraceum TaxID=92696 RepID=A0A4R0RIM7_9APHY|nr:hypothetical protein EIP91_002338 [Steccherinum ochraceum]